MQEIASRSRSIRREVDELTQAVSCLTVETWHAVSNSNRKLTSSALATRAAAQLSAQGQGQEMRKSSSHWHTLG